MGKLFGTDGIRGVANETLDAKLAYRVGQAAAISLCDDSGTKPTVVIGKDTRISSDMLEGALVAGLTACGCNAILLGVVPTPAVAYLTVYLHADAGVVISASHNPYSDNGIKFFDADGFKLPDEVENEIFNREEREIPSGTIGELVMNKLKDLDAVAYVRFASVYREFKDVNTFMDELKSVLNDKNHN